MLEATLSTTHSLLSSLHSATGLPWSATLPLAALLIRLSITTPLTLYTRRSQQRQLSLQPLLQGWQTRLRQTVISESSSLGPAECERLAKKAVRTKRRELHARWGCPAWKNWLPPVIQLPVFLVVIETIRRMCGASAGLLTLATSPFRSLPTPDTPRTEALDALSSSVTPDLSMATEGPTLWLPSLLDPDPLLLLPFLLSGTLLTNIHLLGQRSPGKQPTTFQRRLTTTLRLLALAIGPATLAVPSAMLLYWTASAGLAVAQTIVLERFMPLRLPVTPCRPRKARSLVA
ncbi:MAG: hypothetical protein M1832_000125 [Thelocarpon impressellum]|nr:MAG: hypothetical protein M1832_000125 [Thelocarpon impressellum]